MEQQAIITANNMVEGLTDVVQAYGIDNARAEHFLVLVREVLDDKFTTDYEQRFLDRIFKHCERLAQDVDANQ